MRWRSSQGFWSWSLHSAWSVTCGYAVQCIPSSWVHGSLFRDFRGVFFRDFWQNGNAVSWFFMVVWVSALKMLLFLISTSTGNLLRSPRLIPCLDRSLWLTHLPVGDYLTGKRFTLEEEDCHCSLCHTTLGEIEIPMATWLYLYRLLRLSVPSSDHSFLLWPTLLLDIGWRCSDA